MSETSNWLDRSAEVHPQRIAVADVREQLTYAALRSRAGSLAAALAGAGVGPGDPVAIDLPAGIAHAVGLHGAILAGAVVQSLPPGGRRKAAVAAATTFVGDDLIATAEKAVSEWTAIPREGGAPLTRVLTSGTSGEPRPILLTAANHAWSARASGWNLGVEPDDRWLCCLPLNHVGGLTILLRSAIYGTAAVIEDGFDVARVLDLLEGGAVTIASLVPTQLVRLLDAGAPLDRPRLLLIGGGPLPLGVLEQALDSGATVVQTYGLTEACSQVCTLAPAEARERAGSAGLPLSGTEVRIEADEILVRGPTVAPAAVAEDGWLHTGDLGRLDDEGYLWVEGRRDDLIVTGGENVRPERVEEALRSHPDVADAGVTGRDDREWGQIVVASVVASSDRGVDQESLLDHARSVLERHEVPKRIEVVGTLPRTASGKLQRRLIGPGQARGKVGLKSRQPRLD